MSYGLGYRQGNSCIWQAREGWVQAEYGRGMLGKRKEGYCVWLRNLVVRKDVDEEEKEENKAK